MSEPNVNSAAPVAGQTDFQAWSKLPEDERDAIQTAPSSSAAEPTKVAAAAEPAPASDPDINDQEQAKEAAAKEDAEVPKGLQKRFKELTTKIKNLEAAAAAKPAAAEPAKPAEPVKVEPAAATPAGRPDPNDPKYKSYDEYILDLQNWNLDQRDQRKQREAADQAAATADAERGRNWQKALNEARERYDDYDAVALTDLPLNRATHDAIVQSGQDGAELAYYLGQHPDEAAEIFKLSPVATTLALGKIIASFAKPDQTPKPAVSRAPRPPKPVGSGGGADSIGKEPDPSDYPKWSKWNAKREAALEAAD